MAAGLPIEGRLAKVPRAGSVARKDVPTCGLQDRVVDVRDRVRATGWQLCYVVNQQRVVLGQLRAKEIETPDDEATAEAAMRPGPSTFRPNVLASQMAEYMRKHDMERAPITTSDGVLVGAVTREDAERESHVAEGHA